MQGGGELVVQRESLFPERDFLVAGLNLAARGVLCFFFVVIFDLSGADSRATAQAPGTGAIAGMNLSQKDCSGFLRIGLCSGLNKSFVMEKNVCVMNTKLNCAPW